MYSLGLAGPESVVVPVPKGKAGMTGPGLSINQPIAGM